MIDFKFNYPSIDEEKEALQHFLSSRTPNDIQQALKIPSFQGQIEHTKELGALMQLDWRMLLPTSDLVLCTSANQALSCLLQGLRFTHRHIMTEAFTYTSFKSIALNNQYQVLSVPIYSDGIDVEQLTATIETTKARLLYIQPTIQNPTCAVLPLAKREQLVALARKKDLLIIEDDAYRFLHPSPPPTLLEMAPERTIHIYSLAKPFNPLIKVTFVILPKYLVPMMVDQVRFTSSGTSALLSQFADHLLKTDALASFIKKKQALAQERQRMAASFLQGLTYQTHPMSFHFWLTLPPALKATEVMATLQAQGLLVANGADCAFSEEGERHIRIALGAESHTERLEKGLQMIKEVLAK